MNGWQQWPVLSTCSECSSEQVFWATSLMCKLYSSPFSSLEVVCESLWESVRAYGMHQYASKFLDRIGGGILAGILLTWLMASWYLQHRPEIGVHSQLFCAGRRHDCHFPGCRFLHLLHSAIHQRNVRDGPVPHHLRLGYLTFIHPTIP